MSSAIRLCRETSSLRLETWNATKISSNETELSARVAPHVSRPCLPRRYHSTVVHCKRRTRHTAPWRCRQRSTQVPLSMERTGGFDRTQLISTMTKQSWQRCSKSWIMYAYRLNQQQSSIGTRSRWTLKSTYYSVCVSIVLSRGLYRWVSWRNERRIHGLEQFPVSRVHGPLLCPMWHSAVVATEKKCSQYQVLQVFVPRTYLHYVSDILGTTGRMNALLQPLRISTRTRTAQRKLKFCPQTAFAFA